MATGEQSLEQRLEELLDTHTFDPPPEFADQALIRDMSEHERAESDPVGWWEQQAEALHWFSKWDTALDDSDPPFYKWFAGGKINASHNCLDRHVEAGNGDRVAFHWRGGGGGGGDNTPSPLPAHRQKVAHHPQDPRAPGGGG